MKQKIEAYISLLLTALLCRCGVEAPSEVPGNDQTGGLKFVSSPITTVVHNARYVYIVEAQATHDSVLIYKADHIPGWLQFDESTHELAGTPTADNLGSHLVVLIVSNNRAVITQSFTVDVKLREDAGGAWATYSPYRWTHDGQPFRGKYCDVYSDGANDDVKAEMGVLAEKKFGEILQLFNYNNLGDFRFPPGYNKIQLYINRLHQDNIAVSYWGCTIITIRCAHMDDSWRRYADYTVKHELTHAFEFLIEGTALLGTDVWFREGIAVLIGGGSPLGVVTQVNELESWIGQNQNAPNRGNPISIHQWADFPAGANYDQYYRFSELAIRYLVHAKGGGRSWQDVLNLLYDVRNKVPFPNAFQNNFGMSLEKFQGEYFERMRSFLSSSGS
jgi:hypothetical protein